MCGLCNVNVYTPMDQTRQFARIECLAPRVAEELQHFLNDILTTQVFLAPQAAQIELEEDNSHDQSALGTSSQPHAAHDKSVAHGGHDAGNKAFHGEATEAA